jgi:hypothetical protein
VQSDGEGVRVEEVDDLDLPVDDLDAQEGDLHG